MQNKQLLQNQFNNQMQLAAGRAGQYNTNAGAYDTRAGQTAGMWARIGQGVGTIVGGLNKPAATPTTNQTVTMQPAFDSNSLGSLQYNPDDMYKRMDWSKY